MVTMRLFEIEIFFIWSNKKQEYGSVQRCEQLTANGCDKW